MCDFEFVRAAETCCMEEKRQITYRYENLTLGFDDHMLVMDGKISFQSCRGVTEYHGRFTDEVFRVLLQFNWKGNLKKMKTAFLLPIGFDAVGRRHYRGRDSMGNTIKMTEYSRLQWCSRCTAWHPVHAGPAPFSIEDLQEP